MEIITDGTLPPIPEPPAHGADVGDIGIAVDIGTTTIALNVWSIAERKKIAVVAEENAQLAHGRDIITRISFALGEPFPPVGKNAPSGEATLHHRLVAQLERLFRKAVAQAQGGLPRGFRPTVNAIVLAGNTAMLSFACAVPVAPLSKAPFAAASLFGCETTWKAVREGSVTEPHISGGNPPNALFEPLAASVVPDSTPVYIPPCVGAFIGADTVCAMLAAGFPVPGDAPAPASPPLLLDIGTNSEIALYVADTAERNGRILCTAAAAGPAFEAANISCGMGAVEGAIDSIAIERGTIVPHTIGGGKAKGICGSGLVSAVAALLAERRIEKDGAVAEAGQKRGSGVARIELAPSVCISQKDIRNLQLAKAAVKTGLCHLLEKSPAPPVLHIAGGFGTKISMKDALAIGMIPEELSGRAVSVGNAALAGASALIFSPALRQKAHRLKEKTIVLNLAAIPGFQDRFLKSIDF